MFSGDQSRTGGGEGEGGGRGGRMRVGETKEEEEEKGEKEGVCLLERQRQGCMIAWLSGRLDECVWPLEIVVVDVGDDDGGDGGRHGPMEKTRCRRNADDAGRGL